MPKHRFQRRRQRQRRFSRNSKKFDLIWSELQDLGEDILRAIVQEEKNKYNFIF